MFTSPLWLTSLTVSPISPDPKFEFKSNIHQEPATTAYALVFSIPTRGLPGGILGYMDGWYWGGVRPEHTVAPSRYASTCLDENRFVSFFVDSEPNRKAYWTWFQSISIYWDQATCYTQFLVTHSRFLSMFFHLGKGRWQWAITDGSVTCNQPGSLPLAQFLTGNDPVSPLQAHKYKSWP
jgi:hypothetical protein